MELKTILIIAVALIFFGLMIWMFQGKSEKEVFKKLRLFPRWFKYLGLVIFIISAILPFKYDLLYEGKNYIGVNSASLGLFLICFARDKIEDEMTNLIRLKSFYSSVVLGFVYVTVTYMFNVIGENEGDFISGIQLVFFILVIYLVSYYITKSKIRSEK